MFLIVQKITKNGSETIKMHAIKDGKHELATKDGHAIPLKMAMLSWCCAIVTVNAHRIR